MNRVNRIARGQLLVGLIAAIFAIAFGLLACTTAANGSIKPGYMHASVAKPRIRPASPLPRTREIRPKIQPSHMTGSAGYLPYIAETYDNCGPASISAVLAHWGIHKSQARIGSAVRDGETTLGMAPYDVGAYLRTLHMSVLVGVRGSEALVKSFISNGFPVIVNQWLSASNRLSHYRPVVSYDDRNRTFVSPDPYIGPHHLISFRAFRNLWGLRDRRFIVIYPPSRGKLVGSILSQFHWKYRRAYRADLKWFEPELASPQLTTAGTWLNYYGYVAAAWSADQAGEYRIANHYLVLATAAGENPVLMRWVRADMRRLQSHS